MPVVTVPSRRISVPSPRSAPSKLPWLARPQKARLPPAPSLCPVSEKLDPSSASRAVIVRDCMA